MLETLFYIVISTHSFVIVNVNVRFRLGLQENVFVYC